MEHNFFIKVYILLATNSLLLEESLKARFFLFTLSLNFEVLLLFCFEVGISILA